MAKIPPNISQIADHPTAQALLRLVELIDSLDARLTICEAQAATNATDVAGLPAVDAEVKRLRSLVARQRSTP